MANYMKIMEQWKSWRFDEPINEHTVTFTKDEMEKLHKDGKVVKADPDGKEHTYVYNESVNENIMDKIQIRSLK